MKRNSNEEPSDPSAWRAWFREADQLPEDAAPAMKQARGRKLEKILWEMFEEAGFRPRLSYRPAGEEIDGSIWLHGRTVLIEAKWTKDPHPASSLYQFRGKVDGKLVGTLGLFISIAGFSTDAVDALVAGKELNLILADGDDLRQIVNGQMSVTDALDLKFRAAGDAGTPFLPLRSVSVGLHRGDPGYSIVFVEGPFDARVLQIVRKIFDARSEVTIVPTAGAANMAPLIDAVFSMASGPRRLTAVVDGEALSGRHFDNLGKTLELLLSNYRDDLSAEVVPLEPDLDSVFGLVNPYDGWEERRKLRRLSDERLEEVLRSVDIPQRTQSNPSLATVLQAIGVDIPEIAVGHASYLRDS